MGWVDVRFAGDWPRRGWERGWVLGEPFFAFADGFREAKVAIGGVIAGGFPDHRNYERDRRLARVLAIFPPQQTLVTVVADGGRPVHIVLLLGTATFEVRLVSFHDRNGHDGAFVVRRSVVPAHKAKQVFRIDAGRLDCHEHLARRCCFCYSGSKV
uniref:(northern house mosquito) hypothetical protein n=1 Tax=Culex pipiens TaxID=7175 RepID=A0A8D8GH71_CULPI